MTQFYADEVLSPRRAKTAEGYLVCKDVAIARLGVMLYGKNETPVPVNDAGEAFISRNAADLFRDETVMSFQGKPVTLDHPAVDVTSDNWGSLSKGVVINPRRGDGVESDLLLADLLITDKAAIAAVESGKLEVSCGYDAQYFSDRPGQGEQRNIVGNHVALVERGRCGPRCAIRDSERQHKTRDAASMSLKDKLSAAFKNRDEDGFAKLMERVEPTLAPAKTKTRDADSEDIDEMIEEKIEELLEGKIGDSIARAIDKAFKARDKAAKAKARDADGDNDDDDEDDEDKKKKKNTEDRKTKDGLTFDSARAATDMQEIVSRAEILSPGVKAPTQDAIMTAEKFRDCACEIKRNAIVSAMSAPKTKDMLSGLSGMSADFKTAPPAVVDMAFVAASEMVKQSNNSSTRGVGTYDAFLKPATGTIDSINKKAAEHWAKQNVAKEFS